MSYIVITADFPGIRSDEMHAIYDRLQNGSWTKMHDHNGHLDTSWMSSFASGLSEAEAIQIAQASFMACCSPYTHPILVLQWHNNEPAVLHTK